VIVDPGPDDDQHIPRIASLGRIALVLISHRHADHTDGIDKLVELTGRDGAVGGQRLLSRPRR
jgi:glyoxylase-like metal-dependent hydrolase (beta-lactamase superfamily II)